MKVVFLDRDGVINKYPGDTNYVNNWSEFKFISGSIEGIKKLNSCGFKLCVVSNQAGVSKGLYTQQDLNEINKNMIKEFNAQGAEVEVFIIVLILNQTIVIVENLKPDS